MNDDQGSRITVPTLAEINERIRSCREELNALKRLFRLAKAAEDAARLQQSKAAIVDEEQVLRAWGA